MRKCWDVDYYVRHHMVGGFFNDAHGTGKPVNATYVTHEIRLGYQHPYESAPWVSKRVFLCATRDIAAGEELLVTYGTTYHNIHFASSSPALSVPHPVAAGTNTKKNPTPTPPFKPQLSNACAADARHDAACVTVAGRKPNAHQVG